MPLYITNAMYDVSFLGWIWNSEVKRCAELMEGVLERVSDKQLTAVGRWRRCMRLSDKIAFQWRLFIKD